MATLCFPSKNAGLAHLKRALGATLFAGVLLSSGQGLATEGVEAEATRNDPLQLVVSIDRQHMEVYRGTELISSTRVSTGKSGHTTPRGIFSILEKRRRHFSNIYDNAPMPYMQRLTWSGIALHEGRVPGYPASHGCIRLPRGTASQLFSATERGSTHVIVARGEVRPQAFSHPNLPLSASVIAARNALITADTEFADTPLRTASLDPSAVLVQTELRLGFSASPVALPEIAMIEPVSEKPIRVLITHRTGRERNRDVQHLLTMIGFEPGPIDGLVGRNTRAAIKDFQEAHGLEPTGQVDAALEDALYETFGKPDRMNGHIYVRQGFKPIFDAPVSIKGGDAPLGTHIYTAQDFIEGDLDIRWTALTAEEAEGSDFKSALDRVELPSDVIAKLQDRLTPGSSIIVSDHGISRETGKGTDFVVLTK